MEIKPNLNIDKNLKMMSISAIILVVLFFYTLIKSDTVIQGSSYYLGVGFLFVLLFLTFILQKYKLKIREYIAKKQNPTFQDVLANTANTTEEKTSVQNDTYTTISPINSTITFKDVAGIQEIKDELEEIVDFLNNPKKYQKYDVVLPKGVLLVGPPGVGKTLIAKAVAGEANVPFFYQSGASFVHIYVGMGAKKVRELFSVAKKHAPSIVFIDEIDAVGKSRGVGSNDEREATLNELLTQMDGFDSSSGVMVIAATNKIEVLDEALLRAGRFDRRVFLSLPSKQDRLDILKLYLKNKSHNFDIENLATATSGFSSSAIATLINEALLHMIKRDGTSLLEVDIEFAKNKVQFGKKQLTILTEQQKEILSIYQAGKAYISKEKTYLLEYGSSQEELQYLSQDEIEHIIKKYLAGSVALKVIKKSQYVVYEDDISKAYEIATKMVEKYKFYPSVDNIIQKLQDSLSVEFIENLEKIKQLQKDLISYEVVYD